MYGASKETCFKVLKAYSYHFIKCLSYGKCNHRHTRRGGGGGWRLQPSPLGFCNWLYSGKTTSYSGKRIFFSPKEYSPPWLICDRGTYFCTVKKKCTSPAPPPPPRASFSFGPGAPEKIFGRKTSGNPPPPPKKKKKKKKKKHLCL